MLAEAVSFTEEEMFVILLVLLGMLAAAVAVVVLGCIWAWRAGRGSQLGLAGMIVVMALEASVFMPAAAAALGGNPFVILPAGALAAQTALYLVARNRQRTGR